MLFKEIIKNDEKNVLPGILVYSLLSPSLACECLYSSGQSTSSKTWRWLQRLLQSWLLWTHAWMAQPKCKKYTMTIDFTMWEMSASYSN